LAWLNATPEGSKRPRLASFRELDEDSSFLKLPDTEGAEYIISLLYEAGLFSTNGMGIVPLPWSEIESWLRCTHANLTVWELLTIRELSEAYVGEYTQASAKDRPAPYMKIDDDIIENRTKVAAKLKNVFASLRRNPKPELE
jgi:hypothetical protein